ncbi:SRPBCC family protein [Luteimonas sp. R10]|uniref:SRPBCC family protein n=1 Tax=Luteimonas sp. R10 TaxID=3108176 RepID=UPI00308C3AAD|nr:SRPBCC domain-containing protein [Luteimonas sp. R10]
MPALERLQWSVDIAAPASRIYQMLVGPESYGQWTSAFGDGLYFEGSWEKGQRIRFLTPSGHGVLSEIAENRPGELLSIRHLGYIDDDGVEDTSSEAILTWVPAYENYGFTAIPDGTRLTVEQDMTEDFASMVDTWPKALERLKALCEGPIKSSPLGGAGQIQR